MPSDVNHFIEKLPRADRSRLLGQCETVELAKTQMLSDGASATRHVYFPMTSCVSLLTPEDAPPVLEVGMVGCEGMIGLHTGLGIPKSTIGARVQGAGSAWRMPAGSFKEELRHNRGLRNTFNRYLYVTLLQLSTEARCLRYHRIDQRLSRWLLMNHDRAQQSAFDVTHEAIAGLLGVRRVGITQAASELQRRGYIEYGRGRIKIMDRAGLESASCSCYAADRLSYSQGMS